MESVDKILLILSVIFLVTAGIAISPLRSIFFVQDNTLLIVFGLLAAVGVLAVSARVLSEFQVWGKVFSPRRERPEPGEMGSKEIQKEIRWQRENFRRWLLVESPFLIFASGALLYYRPPLPHTLLVVIGMLIVILPPSYGLYKRWKYIRELKEKL